MQTMSNAIVLFVDVRGFTRWSQDVDCFQHIKEFAHEFYEIIYKNFSGEDTYIKKSGDGVMIVKEINKDIDQLRNINKEINDDVVKKLLKTLLEENLEKIDKVNRGFEKLCKYFSDLSGYKTELYLGWGITRGIVQKIYDNNIDYLSPNINKSSRLCNIARPFGIVIEKDDFPELPERFRYDFLIQTKLEGIIDNVDVWITKEIATEFIPREKIRERPEVHVAGICIKIDNKTIKMLIAKRNINRELYPGLYEGCGGQLAYSEYFTDGIKRHFKFEMNIDVEILENIHKFYKIEMPNQPLIPGIRYICIYKGGFPESKNHSEIKWVNEEELDNISSEEFIPYLKDEIMELIDTFKREMLENCI